MGEIHQRLCFSKAQKKTEHCSAWRKHLLQEARKDLSGFILRYDFYNLHLTYVLYKYFYLSISGITDKYFNLYFILM